MKQKEHYNIKSISQDLRMVLQFFCTFLRLKLLNSLKKQTCTYVI